MFKPLPSQKNLHRLFDYDTATGIFTYKMKPNFRIKVGSVAGTVKKSGKCKDYCFIKVDGELYQASRLAWMYVYGVDPGGLTVDHIDRNPSNNSIANLRLATLGQQSFNRNSKNKSGARGVTYLPNKNKYYAAFKSKELNIRLSKYFETIEEASEWYESIRKQYGKEFATKFE